MLLRSKYVFPVDAPPIEDGALRLENGRVAAIGKFADLSRHGTGGVTDLGDSAILPGLVNAHCHLDYTAMAGEIPATTQFSDWIKSITTLKAGWSYSEFADSWIQGSHMLVETGTTRVADIEAVPELLPEVWNATPIRVHSFLEMTGVRSRRNPADILADACRTIEMLSAQGAGIGLSPHAPYSTTPQLLKLAADCALKQGLRVTTHVAESVVEYEMFMYRRGPLFEWLKRNERDMSDCGEGSPIRHLLKHGILGPHFIAVHVNYLWDHDAEILGRHRSHVVHCPTSHDFFKHQRFAWPELQRHRVNVALGTDSLASTRKQSGSPLRLSLFREMKTFAQKNPAAPPHGILEMATWNGAKALGVERDSGRLGEGSLADLIVCPARGKMETAIEELIWNTETVDATMIGGRWVYSKVDAAQATAA